MPNFPLPPNYTVMYKNRIGQKLLVFAWDSDSGEPVTGDEANITIQTVIDGGPSAALQDTNPVEVDATNHPGWYSYDLAQSETNGTVILFTPVSSTNDVLLTGIVCHTVAWPEAR